jgi:hypothetical protein
MSVSRMIPDALRLATAEQLRAELDRRDQETAFLGSLRLLTASVVAVVAQDAGLSAQAITGRSRLPEVSRARQLAMFLLRVRFGLKFQAIAAVFDRTHGTVIFAVSAVGHRRLFDPALADRLQRLDNAVAPLMQPAADPFQIYHFAAETVLSAAGSTRSPGPSCPPGNP